MTRPEDELQKSPKQSFVGSYSVFGHMCHVGWRSGHRIDADEGRPARELTRLWTGVGRMISFGPWGARLRWSVGRLDSQLLRFMIIRQVLGGYKQLKRLLCLCQCQNDEKESAMISILPSQLSEDDYDKEEAERNHRQPLLKILAYRRSFMM